ncbi:MAG: tryptophan--tRNA ligase [Planctomycetota bacterium]|jgi:tryptophanyl-tRNA synthetase|nr:tryptophan--tRNA ligase [Planctomycetota bacterium]
MKRVLSGVRPTGQLHLGNYCGAIRQFVDLQHSHELFIFIASYHALTTHSDPEALRASIRQVAIDYIAFGLDPAKVALYRQQDLPQVTELAWLLACQCPMYLSDKGVTYKDFQAKGLTANVGIYNYPILQAADILITDADLVPVGKDQVQNVEICRDLAGRFNHHYGQVFKLPEYRLADGAQVLPGIDGQKMSKSYDNIIDPFMDEKPLRKRLNKIKTDSTPMEDTKDPDACPVYQIFRAIAGVEDERTVQLATDYRAGGLGYGDAKKRLFELILDHFGPARARRAELMADPEQVEAILRDGAERAREVGTATVNRARAACGL